jgi:hypothetical protein
MRFIRRRQNYHKLLSSLAIITCGVYYWLFDRPFYNTIITQHEQVFAHKKIKKKQCPTMPMLGKPEKIDFIQFPHRTLKINPECLWKTDHLSQDSCKNDTSCDDVDRVQEDTLRDGFCDPLSKEEGEDDEHIHIFSTQQALMCLKNKRVFFGGDSFAMQLFFGLADILLSNNHQHDVEITNGWHRVGFLKNTLKVIQDFHDLNPTEHPFIDFVECNGPYHEAGCYGRGGDPGYQFSTNCSSCLQNFMREKEWDVMVISSAIHIIGQYNQSEAINQVIRFLNMSNQVIYASMPGLNTDQLTYDYAKNGYDYERDGWNFYASILPHLAPKSPQHPFLDFFHLSKSCRWENCTNDGYHRARFVNRWKAQILFNTICHVEY